MRKTGEATQAVVALTTRVAATGSGSRRWPKACCGPGWITRLLRGVWLGLLMATCAGSALAGVVPRAPDDKADMKGTVRVLVQLQVAAKPEGELASAEAVAAQRKAIATAQSAVLRELVGTSYRVVRTYETIPFLALEVSLGALRALEETALVMGVEEDRLDSPQRTPNRPGADEERAPADENSCIPW